jgi:hypothetical protein
LVKVSRAVGNLANAAKLFRIRDFCLNGGAGNRARSRLSGGFFASGKLRRAG